jgi:hypothetical protein
LSDLKTGQMPVLRKVETRDASGPRVATGGGPSAPSSPGVVSSESASVSGRDPAPQQSGDFRSELAARLALRGKK